MSWLGMRWPRVTELFIGMWIGIVPWLFDAPSTLLVHDTVLAFLVLAVTALSLARPRSRVHLLHLISGGWLAGVALLVSRSIHDATAQSELLAALMLIMFAIIPTDTMQVPTGWRKFFAEHPDAANQEADFVAAYERQARPARTWRSFFTSRPETGPASAAASAGSLPSGPRETPRHARQYGLRGKV